MRLSKAPTLLTLGFVIILLLATAGLMWVITLAYPENSTQPPEFQATAQTEGAKPYIISEIAPEEIYLIQALRYSASGLGQLGMADTAGSLSQGVKEIALKYRIINITTINQVTQNGSVTSALIVQVIAR